LFFPFSLFLYPFFCSSLSPSPFSSWLARSLHAYMFIFLFITYMLVAYMLNIFLCHLFVTHRSLFTCATYIACSSHAYVTYSSSSHLHIIY
jgi:hypothetical protein